MGEGGRTIKDSSGPVVKFGSIIKERRKVKGMTQTDLADEMGVIRNTVVNWEADKAKPEFDSIPKLCSILGISTEDLFGAHGADTYSEDEKKLVRNYRALSMLGQQMAQKSVYGMLQAELEAEAEKICRSFEPIVEDLGAYAAGRDEPYSDDKDDTIFIRRTPMSIRADFIAHVKGRSMEPDYRDGDLIYCRNSSVARPGQDVVCTTSEGKLIKRIGEDGMLFSVNPAPEYKVRIMYDDDELRIRGIVLGIVKRSDFPSQKELITLNELQHDVMKKYRAEHNIYDEW